MNIPPSLLGHAPYPGLRPFRSDETGIFFGREAQVDALLEKLGHFRFLAVIGPSGCGKSSLVRAGMIPALETGLLARAGVRWRVATMRPGERPLRRLAEALFAASGLSLEPDPEAVAFLHATLRRGPRGLVEVLRDTPLPEGTNLLLLVDQFEEIFRYRQQGDSDEADAFVALLLATAEQHEVPVYVVITMRSDFLGDCAVFHGLLEAINAGQFLTPRLTREQRREAIVGPAMVFGGQVEPALVNRLLNDTGEELDQLPLLQHVLMRMWTCASEAVQVQHDTSYQAEALRDVADPAAGVTLTLDDYEQVGGLAQALSHHADEAYETLDAAQQRIAAVLFHCLSERSPTQRDTRRPVQLGAVAAVADVPPAQVAAVADVFRHPDRSFLTPSADVALHPDTVLDISHESLIRQWQRLNTWAEQETEAAETYRRLAQTARLWKRGQAALWSTPDLENALAWKERERPTSAWAARYGQDFALAMEFLDASEHQRLEAQQREEAVRQSKLHQVRRQLAWALVGLCLAVGLALWAMWERQRAGEAKNVAEHALVATTQAREEAERAQAHAERSAQEAEKRQAAADQARVAAEHARSDAEGLVAFLIGESFLEQLRPVGRNAILKEVQKKVWEYLDKVPDQDQPGQLRTRGLALRNEGDLLLSYGELAKAIAKFRDSDGVFERWAASAPESPEPKVERARTLNELGDALLYQGKITESLKTHREELALRQTLYDGGDHGVETTLDLADSNSSVGRMLNQMGQLRQALVHLDRARDLLQAQASAPRTPRVLKVWHNVIDNRAESLELMSDEQGKRDAHEDAQRIVQEWVQGHPLSADARGRQVIAVSRLANEQMDSGAVKEALEQYKQINRLVDELTRWDETNTLWQRDFAATLILMAEGQWAAKQYRKALNAYDRALKLLEGLAKTDTSNMQLKLDLFWLYRSRGTQALVRKEWERATEDFATAERYIAEAARADRAFVAWRRQWSLVLFDLANARRGAGNSEEATVWRRQGQDMISDLIKAAPEMTVLQQELDYFRQTGTENPHISSSRPKVRASARR